MLVAQHFNVCTVGISLPQPQHTTLRSCLIAQHAFFSITYFIACVHSCDSVYHLLMNPISCCSTSLNRGDHVEVITIDFDPTIVSYYDLLQLFWNNHEYGLTTRVKRQYASIIQYHDEKQKEIAERSLAEEIINRPNETIITSVEAAAAFHPAEE